MSLRTSRRLALAVEPRLLATMLERALEGTDYEVTVLDRRSAIRSGEFDVVIASGRVPSGVFCRATIRLPAPHASATAGILRRPGMVEIVQLPTVASLMELIDRAVDDVA